MNRFTEDDDEQHLAEEISTRTFYVSLPVGKRITGVFVEFKPDVDLNGNPTKRPVLMVDGDTVILPHHHQLVAAMQRVRRGDTVRVACIEKSEIAGGKTVWNYKVSVDRHQAGDDDLPS